MRVIFKFGVKSVIRRSCARTKPNEKQIFSKGGQTIISPLLVISLREEEKRQSTAFLTIQGKTKYLHWKDPRSRET